MSAQQAVYGMIRRAIASLEQLRAGGDEVTNRSKAKGDAAEREVAALLRAQIERVRELCAEARVGNSRGCTCYGNECSGNCGRGEPFSWTLDPQAVLRALDGDGGCDD